MQFKGMLLPLPSLEFRVHTPVLITLLVAMLGTVVIWAALLRGLFLT